MENQNKETFSYKHSIMPIIFSVLFGFFCFYLAFYGYNQFTMFENGEIQTISAPRAIIAIYDILGVWGIAGFCIIM